MNPFKSFLCIILLLLCNEVFAQQPYNAKGKASFYGNEFNGRKTASGEKFSNNKFTAAHKTLPFGTRVKVTNLANNKWCIVTINDRGPFIKGRIIDLSRVAADSLDYIQSGFCEVLVEEISIDQESLLLTGKDTFISKQFPEKWIGKWKGEVNTFNDKKFIKKSSMQLTIERIDSNKFSWIIKSISKGDTTKNNYQLVIQKSDSNRFYIDEGNHIKIPVQLIGNSLLSRFDKKGFSTDCIYTLSEGEIIYQLVGADSKFTTSVGEVSIDNKTGSTVKNINLISEYQIGTLKKEE